MMCEQSRSRRRLQQRRSNRLRDAKRALKNPIAFFFQIRIPVRGITISATLKESNAEFPVFDLEEHRNWKSPFAMVKSYTGQTYSLRRLIHVTDGVADPPVFKPLLLLPMGNE